MEAKIVPNYKRSVNISSREAESLLERVITELIARDLKIKPEQITPEFIHKWRMEHLYPKALVDLTTTHGGYNGEGRRVLTGEEVESSRKKAEAFFKRNTA